ncbi:MAG: hypothetical protein BIFFINMI_04183 [Phycisphaerae bacterium]|nr:hypothetical protein [Phycisphaerae bacterium]CAG0931884.1 hypothetical protein RHDC3_02017 [Rhodocyclaceae bacterium]
MNAPHEISAAVAPEVALRPLCETLPTDDSAPAFLFDCNVIPANPQRIEGIVAPERGQDALRQLLLAGAQRVYIGEAALLDGSLVEALAAEFGAERIGLYLPLQRMQVSWSMDAVSNADFRVMTPSVCEPCWEILRADGTRSGTHAAWWIGEMFKRGASSALLRVDMTDDADLNILAGLSERWGERLWLAPLADPAPDFAAWVELGGVRRIAASEGLLQSDPYLAALASGPDFGLPNEGTG